MKDERASGVTKSTTGSAKSRGLHQRYGRGRDSKHQFNWGLMLTRGWRCGGYRVLLLTRVKNDWCVGVKQGVCDLFGCGKKLKDLKVLLCVRQMVIRGRAAVHTFMCCSCAYHQRKTDVNGGPRRALIGRPTYPIQKIYAVSNKPPSDFKAHAQIFLSDRRYLAGHWQRARYRHTFPDISIFLYFYV